jgi:hypothetical protein
VVVEFTKLDDVAKSFDEVLFVVLAFTAANKVVVPLVTDSLVTVAFAVVRFVVEAVTAANNVVVPLVETKLVAKRFVAVALVVEAFTEAKSVAVALVKLALVANKLVKYATRAESPPVVDALPVTVRLVIVVVASVVVPKTLKSPVEVAPVLGSVRNEVFSVHAEPFQ